MAEWDGVCAEQKERKQFPFIPKDKRKFAA
jgi:hypothetical protein